MSSHRDSAVALAPASHEGRGSVLGAALLSEDEAAAWFGISKRTFQSLRDAAWMPAPIVLGPRLLRWSVDELRAAVAKMPRQTERAQPESLLRTRIERAKTTGDLR